MQMPCQHHPCAPGFTAKELTGMPGASALQVQGWVALADHALLRVQVVGIDAHQAAGQPVWRLFARPFAEDSPAWEAAMEVAARGDEFILRCCRVADAPERGTFSLQFRSAALYCYCNPFAVASRQHLASE